MPGKIALGADHAGFDLKTTVHGFLEKQGYEVLDLGTFSTDAVDYPDFALAVGQAIVEGKAERGVLVCGSGVGASVAANKVPGVRAGLIHDTFSAHQGVEDDDMNVLCFGARVVGPALALEILKAWLGATFSGAERHVRRLKKIADIEKRYSMPATKA
ncbi:MAG TPA: ribose 5-phosphate isomerase B [Planktothrix sp.]|jgi:ribose 5-phosphate isomerase B